MDETTATRRLTRDPSDKVIAGVAAGLGRYFGIDPTIFRLAFVGFALFGGGGVLLYLIAWVAMPAGDEHERTAPTRGSSVELAAWLGLALVLIALLMLGGALFTLRPGFVAALVLLAGGFLLFQHSAQERAAVAPPPPGPTPPPPGPPSPEPTQAASTAPGSGAFEPEAAETDPLSPQAPVTPPPRFVVEPRPRPPRSRLGRVTLAALFLALGLLGFLHATAVVFPSPGDYVALALTTVGLGLVAGTWWGRARWLIPIGLLLIPVTLATTLVPRGMDFDSGAGEIYESPASSAELASEYELGGGQLTLDLTSVRLGPGERRHVTASIGVGELLVVVPPGTTVSVRATASVGQVEVFGVRDGGMRPEVQAREIGAGFLGELELELRAGLGQVRVVHASSPMNPFGGPRLRHPDVEVF